MMRYPVLIHKEAGSDYGVTVPDLPGCFSAGESIDDALAQVVEAIECHVEGMLIDGEPIPQPTSIEAHADNPDYANGVWAVVDVDLSKLSGKSKRINITIPEGLVTNMDRYAARQGLTRSALIAEAAMSYMAKEKA